MKKLGITLLLSIVLSSSSSSQFVKTEITEDFKKVVKKIAQEEFKKFIYDKIKESHPVLAATTYDLIDNIVSGESLSTIHESVISSIIDYGTMQMIRECIKPELDSVKNNIVYVKNGKIVNEKDYNKIIYLSVVYIFEALAYTQVQPIGEHIVNLLYSEDAFFNTVQILDDTNRIDIRSFVAYHMTKTGNPYGTLFTDAVIFKSNASSIYRLRKVDSTTLKEMFPDVTADFRSQLSKLNDLTKSYVDVIRYSIDPANTKYTAIIEYCLPYFRSLLLKGDFSSNISDKIFLKNLSKTIENIFKDFESSISYEVGLWAGYFIQGPRWLPDTTIYPFLSLRVSDRIQWAIVRCDPWKIFVYGGGLIDFALRELSKNKQNNYLLAGVGISYQNLSLSASTGFPINNPGEKKWAGIVTVAYDLPLSQIVNSLKD